MKKISAVILSVMILLCHTLIFAAETETVVEGDGTEDNPYILTKSNIENLIQKGCGVQGENIYFKLSEDIYSINITEPFFGVLDGGGYLVSSMRLEEVASRGIIRNIKVSYAKGGNNSAVIGINNGLIENMEVSRNIKRGSEMSAVVQVNTGIIDNCYTTYKVTTNSAGAAGIVYFNNGGIIRNCVNRAWIYTSEEYAGGIAARTSGGIIENCVNMSEVTSEKGIVGGIAGESEGTLIRNCVVSGEVNGSVNAGGILGLDIGNTTVENCYFDYNKNEMGRTAVGSTGNQNGAYTEEELRNPEIYQDFDFETDWAVSYIDGFAVPMVRFGNGSEEHPYLIYNSNDLQLLDGDAGAGKYIRLAASVSTQLEDFKGHLDGNNNTFESVIKILDEGASVRNVYFSKKSTAIEYIYKATVEDCTAATSEYKIYGTGGFVGINDGGVIRNCDIKNSIRNFKHSGILAHINKNGGIIENCTIAVNIFVYDRSGFALSEKENSDMGSIVWMNDNAEINNCEVILFDTSYSDDEAIDKAKQASMAVKNNGTIENCIYSVAE